MALTPPSPLLKKYIQLCTMHNWHQDPAQIQFLTTVSLWTSEQKKTSQSFKNWLKKFYSKRNRLSAQSLQGFYVYGHVGRGKTMLLHLVFQSFDTIYKKIFHFNDFMTHVHSLLHQYRHHSIYDQPIDGVIDDLRKRYKILFLDEFQVTEIADAMLLHRLFDGLLKKGTLVFLTSNLKPQDLYKDGLHFDRFEPFIKLISKKLNIYFLENTSTRDYRQIESFPKKTYFLINSDEDKKEAQILREKLMGSSVHSTTLIVNQRLVPIPEASSTTARFSFKDLCGQPLGAADYLAITDRFKTIFIDNIPPLTADKSNEARRFMILIDTLYAHHIRVILTAQISLDQLYQDTRPQALPFARTLSRLKEMQTEKYWQGSFLKNKSEM